MNRRLSVSELVTWRQRGIEALSAEARAIAESRLADRERICAVMAGEPRPTRQEIPRGDWRVIVYGGSRPWADGVPAPPAAPAQPVPAENLLGLGPRGKPLDLPVPSSKLPRSVRGRLQVLAYSCAWSAAKARLPSARACSHKMICRVWPHRLGGWPEAETASNPESELAAYLDGLIGGTPPQASLRCYANADLSRCKLPVFGTCEGAKTTKEAGGYPPTTDLCVTVISATCAICGRPFTAKRAGVVFCSSGCRQRAYRRRLAVRP